MKKTVIYILSIVIIVFAIVLSKYYNLRELKTEIIKFNLKYEEYLDRKIYGTDIATVINKAINDNKQTFSERNSENYININIKIIDLAEEKIYDMETFYQGGIDEFVKYYGQVTFECKEIRYNSSHKVNFMLFEQISQ